TFLCRNSLVDSARCFTKLASLSQPALPWFSFPHSRPVAAPMFANRLPAGGGTGAEGWLVPLLGLTKSFSFVRTLLMRLRASRERVLRVFPLTASVINFLSSV